jgi:hypothetical protein
MAISTSKKHPVLEYIFKKYYNPAKPQPLIDFYLSDISDGYKATKQSEPASISNTILDLTRQDRGIDSRVPKSISSLGYDLRKKTGQDTNGKKFAGEFVYVGKGNALNSWIIWPEEMDKITIDTSSIPEIVLKLIRQDEGALFSIVDYTHLFNKVLTDSNGEEVEIHRIQNPMKWQPNEIDGFYANDDGKRITIYPVEAKALTTGDEINLDQLQGGFETVRIQFENLKIDADIVPVAVKMVENGMKIAIFTANEVPEIACRYVCIEFEPKLENWTRKSR